MHSLQLIWIHIQIIIIVCKTDVKEQDVIAQ